ncbi:hypothetical protein [Desulfovulcanus sp.]
MNKIKLAQYREQIMNLVNSFEICLEDVKIIDSIQQWCANNNIEEYSDARMGKTVRNSETGKYLILLSTEISLDDLDLILRFNTEFEKDLEMLKTDWDYIKHLTLHEIAHCIYENYSEEDCDKWAFEKMKNS